ncbi:Hypothetical predicted protein [Octopus vulgaris]|uniref:Uncharacterized protein n=1 Tax=Octopus vulgaris TaxID=6645 RepID=A0AA36FFV7_OCTVU|nr:Hypothetical predicted protein [Octopus vulgaris]
MRALSTCSSSGNSSSKCNSNNNTKRLQTDNCDMMDDFRGCVIVLCDDCEGYVLRGLCYSIGRSKMKNKKGEDDEEEEKEAEESCYQKTGVEEEKI